jgi:hypothetical protein
MLKLGKRLLRRGTARSDRRTAERLVQEARDVYEQTGQLATFDSVMAAPDTPSPEHESLPEEEWSYPMDYPPATQHTQEEQRDRLANQRRNVRGRHASGSTQGQPRWRP